MKLLRWIEEKFFSVATGRGHDLTNETGTLLLRSWLKTRKPRSPRLFNIEEEIEGRRQRLEQKRKKGQLFSIERGTNAASK